VYTNNKTDKNVNLLFSATRLFDQIHEHGNANGRFRAEARPTGFGRKCEFAVEPVSGPSPRQQVFAVAAV
jgi:hypothetical protein